MKWRPFSCPTLRGFWPNHIINANILRKAGHKYLSCSAACTTVQIRLTNLSNASPSSFEQKDIWVCRSENTDSSSSDYYRTLSLISRLMQPKNSIFFLNDCCASAKRPKGTDTCGSICHQNGLPAGADRPAPHAVSAHYTPNNVTSLTLGP